MLKIQLSQDPSTSAWIVEDPFLIGSDSANHLVVDGLAPIHARLERHQGELLLVDNGSAKGSYVNGKRVARQVLHAGDSISLAQQAFQLSEHSSAEQLSPRAWAQVARWSLVGESSWFKSQRFHFNQAINTLGRSEHCEICLPGTHLNRQHAEIQVRDQQLLIRDLNSSNGTYVNDRRINESLVNAGDIVRFDLYSFRVEGPKAPPKNTQLASHISNDNNWKLSATSPGNRIERDKRDNNLLLNIFVGALLLSTLALSLLLFLGR